MLDYAAPLDPGGIVREQALAYIAPSAMPCCSLVAIWALTVVGRIPPEADAGIVSLSSWSRLELAWWRMANIWDAKACWSSLIAHQQMLGGRLALDLTGSEPPRLTPGRWHVVQDWEQDYSAGHTYIVFARADRTHRLVQSSKARGYRDHDGLTSWPRKPGRMLGVLTLSTL